MKLHSAMVAGVAGLLLAVGVSAVSLSQPAAGGGAADSDALFTARCKSCHEPPIARAPGREQLRGLSNQQIVEALTSGVMQPMAAGMTPVQIVDLAAFLTGRRAPFRRVWDWPQPPPRRPTQSLMRPRRPSSARAVRYRPPC